MPTKTYDFASSGELLSKLTYDTEQVAEAATKAITVLVRDGLTVIGLLGLMFYQSFILSIGLIVIGPVIAILSAQLHGNHESKKNNGEGTKHDGGGSNSHNQHHEGKKSHSSSHHHHDEHHVRRQVSNRIYSASIDNTIRCWDPYDMSCIFT